MSPLLKIKEYDTYFFLTSLLFFLSFNLIGSETWFHSAGTNLANRFSSLNQINLDSIKELEIVWEFDAAKKNIGLTNQATPIFIGSSIITTGLDGKIFSLEAHSGDLLWETKLAPPSGRRGIVYSEDNNLIFVTHADGLAALHPDNGRIIYSLETELSLIPPIIFKNIIVVSTRFYGLIAFDMKTQKELWKNPLIKNGLQARVWSGMSFDADSEFIFINTANPGGIYGADRTKEDLSSSLIAIDINNGEIKWSYQHIIHDLWDFDLVGFPIIVSSNLTENYVLSLSKTGEIIFLNTLDGTPFFKNSIQKISVPKTLAPNEESSLFQNQITLPQRVINIDVNPEQDFLNLEGSNKDFMNWKLRNARFGEFLPPSLDHDVVTFGLHGGPTWAGASLDSNNFLYVPFNKDPWILRLWYQDKRFLKLEELGKRINSYLQKYGILKEKELISKYSLRWEKGESESFIARFAYQNFDDYSLSELYQTECQSCHGIAAQGSYQNELEGDGYFPALSGITLTKKLYYLNNLDNFNFAHKDILVKNYISNKELSDLTNEFLERDQLNIQNGNLEIKGFWQILLDKDGLPATKPPWGGISKIDLSTGKILWTIPFGNRLTEEKNSIISIGDKNFGGVLSTQSNLLFATGTPDQKIYAFNSETGDQIWSSELPFAGSAPPMTFMYQGCQYLLVQATGGQFVGFQRKNGSKLVAFKLRSCNKI